MKRKQKNRFGLSFDVLTDVLTGLVGIVFLIVILVSLNLGNVTVLNMLKLWKHDNPDNNYVPIRLYLQGQDAFIFNMPLINQSLENAVPAAGLSYENFPSFVNAFNELNVNDQFFQYRLHLEEFWWGNSRRRSSRLVINNKELLKSDSTSQILSFIVNMNLDSLSTADNCSYYLILTPDTNNIDQFRNLRQAMFRDNGIPFTWFPMRGQFSFPDTLAFSGGDMPPPPPPSP